MITVTAMKWAPPFAAGQVRDHRVRWILNEVGWSYKVGLVDAPTDEVGQLPKRFATVRPASRAGGTGAAADVREWRHRARCRHARRALLGAEGTTDRAAAVQWVVAGLNSIEPFLFNVAEVEYFMDDEAVKAARRPIVVAQAKKRLAMLEQARDGRHWFVGDAFSVADLMLASILKIARSLDLLSDLPALAAWQESILARPAHLRAEQDQKAEIARHSPADMHYDAVPKELGK